MCLYGIILVILKLLLKGVEMVRHYAKRACAVHSVPESMGSPPKKEQNIINPENLTIMLLWWMLRFSYKNIWYIQASFQMPVVYIPQHQNISTTHSEKSTKQIQNSIYLVHINVDSLSWLGTCTSIKCDGVKLVLIGPNIS